VRAFATLLFILAVAVCGGENPLINPAVGGACTVVCIQVPAITLSVRGASGSNLNAR